MDIAEDILTLGVVSRPIILVHLDITVDDSYLCSTPDMILARAFLMIAAEKSSNFLAVGAFRSGLATAWLL